MGGDRPLPSPSLRELSGTFFSALPPTDPAPRRLSRSPGPHESPVLCGGAAADRADACRRQHRHDRLGHAGQIAGPGPGIAGTKRRSWSWERRVLTDADGPPAFVIPAHVEGALHRKRYADIPSPSSFPRKRESMRSRGSGVAESEADWWTILRRFVEDFMGKGLRESAGEGRERFDNLSREKP